LGVYEEPYYYEAAFDFRNISKEVDFIEQCAKRFSKVTLKKILDIGCGPSPHMLELAKRGYDFTGLDLSQTMLEYSMQKARSVGANIKTIQADMRNFKTKDEFDFAFCMLGSIVAESNQDFLSHLDSVANCLRSGGVYLINASIQFDWVKLGSESWTVLKDGLIVNVNWQAVSLNLVEQTILETLTIEVIKEGKTKTLKTEKIGKLVFPQEFLQLITDHGKFEMVGWYNDFRFDAPMEKATRVSRPVTLIRRK
jgi:SAM-dependent methyltransferase